MNKTRVLIAAGCFCITAGLIDSFYLHLNDSISGFLSGLGIGLLLISLYKIGTGRKVKS